MSVSTETAGARPAVGTLGLPWIIAASSVGTLIEWYDFYLRPPPPWLCDFK
jgi:hypothetical protein